MEIETESLVRIIVVRYGQEHLERACLSSVIHNTKPPYDLVDYDNFKEKLSLAKIWNELILATDAKWIVLLNSDTLVPKHWLTRLLEIGNQDERIAAIGPSTNHAPTPQGHFWPNSFSKKIAAKPENVEGVNNDLFDSFGLEFEDSELTGFCYLLRRKPFEEVGYFNENFLFYGQESELNHRLRKAGYRTVWAKGVFVWHQGEAYKKIMQAEGRDFDKEHEESVNLYGALTREQES